MSFGSLINDIVGGTAVGQVLGIDDITGVEGAQNAATDAANIQAQGAQRAEEGINRRFDITQENFRPFQEAGVDALGQQQALLGLGGADAQQQAITQQDFNNQFGRLGQIAGQGQNAVTNVSQFGATAANQAGNAAIAQSEARASGILGRQQADSQFNSNVFGLGGMAIGGFLGR